MGETSFDPVRAFRELVERDHREEVAMLLRKADEAAAAGDEVGRESYQRLADRIGALKPACLDRPAEQPQVPHPSA